MTFVPEPEDSGSSGTQTAATALVSETPPERPIAGQPIEQAVVGLAATRSRSMGGEVAAGLIAGSFSQISHELSETRIELRDVRIQLDKARDSLQDEKVINAELKGKLNSAENEKAIRNVCLVAGTAIVGFGIDQARSNQLVAGIILILVGIILSLVGWFSVGGRGQK